ncbi:MAG: type II and III secretion system protein family protein [Acidobacteriota bacterium]|nr:type II and III secretion system protein family protein [Acidobacteriota bacterium]
MRLWLRVVGLLAAAWSFAGAETSDTIHRALTVVIGKGDLLEFTKDVQRVAVSEPKIADAIVVSPREVMVNAKGLGKTTVVVWETGVGAVRYDVDVVSDTSDIEALRKELRGMAGSDVTVSGTSESLVLSGSAPSADVSKHLQALAATHAKTVVNLLQTPTPAEPRQVMLQVKFASVDRSRLAELGFNLFSRNPGGIGEISTQQFQQPRFSQLQFQNQDFSNTTVNFADILNLFLFRTDLNIGATIRAMQSRNVLQILAEPNLITVEGKTASFLAGGQFPFPTLTSTTTGGATAPVITVQFKPFGVQLDFTPTITATGAIHLKVSPEVSSLDFTNSVQLQGFLIPALTTRRAETEVILKDGESFAIAGLIDNRVTQVLNKVRGVGDIPILGQLFRSRSTQKTTDELVVLITPHFVRPMSVEEQAKLPTIEVPFLPTVEQEKATKGKKKKGAQDPQFVGPRGHQEAPKP